MTDPIPTVATEDVFAQQRVIRIPERDTHIPTWYGPTVHPRPEEIHLKKDGVLIHPPTTVAQVAPEHRWAIRPDGEILPQHEFERDFMRWQEEWYTVYRESKPRDWNPHREPIPSVERFVMLGVDPIDKKRLKEIHYDPNATRGAHPDSIYVSNRGEAVTGEERYAILVSEYEKPNHGKLKPWEIMEVEHRRGVQSENPPARAPEKQPYGETALCGKILKGGTEGLARNAKRGHERFCKKCAALREG